MAEKEAKTKEMYWENGILKVRVPVTYEMGGSVLCEFSSVEEMQEKLEDEGYIDMMPLPKDGEYLTGSYDVDLEIVHTYLYDLEG